MARSWFARAVAALALQLSAAEVRAQLVINELEYDEPGKDVGEYVELINTGDEALELSGYTLVFVNGAGAAPHVYRSLELGPGVVAAGGYFVICGDAAHTPHCDLDVSPDQNLIENGPDDALVLQHAGLDVDRVSYEAGPAGPADPGTSAGIGLARCPDAADSGDDARDFRLAPATPAAANSCGDGDAPLGACGEAFTRIGAIQGRAGASTRAGERVEIEAVVVGDFRAGLGGFFVQDADADRDGDPSTSDGLFVVGDAAVASGQRVRLAGTVGEADGLTELSEIGEARVCPGEQTASAARLSFPLATRDALEACEGMRVEIAQTLTVTGNYELPRYGVLDLSAAGRLVQPSQLLPPGAAAAALQDRNDRNRILLDDGSGAFDPAPAPYRDQTGTRRAGDTIAGASGIVDERFGAYRLQPTAAVSFESRNPRPDRPRVPGRLHVASANLHNYFTTLDDGSPHCGPSGALDCRGARTAAELARQRTRLVAELRALDADVVGLLELENNPSQAVADLAVGLNAELGASTYAYVDTGTIGGDAIKVGLLYKPAAVSSVGDYAVLDSDADPSFPDAHNRPVLAQTFSELASGARFTVAVDHWKSKGSACSGDPDVGDGQGNCNRTRVAAAEALAAWLGRDPTEAGNGAVLVIGDFNAYAREDPMRVLESAGYRALEQAFEDSQAYSFQFDGQFGCLDHAFASPKLAPSVRGSAIWHINADEPPSLPDGASGPARASDHDPLIIGLDLAAGGGSGCEYAGGGGT